MWEKTYPNKASGTLVSQMPIHKSRNIRCNKNLNILTNNMIRFCRSSFGFYLTDPALNNILLPAMLRPNDTNPPRAPTTPAVNV